LTYTLFLKKMPTVMNALACLTLLGTAGLTFANPNPVDLQKRCAEQERQIAALEQEIGTLHSQIALERRLSRGAEAAPSAKQPSAKQPSASAAKTPTPAKSAETYKVRSGDTLSSIARRYKTSVKSLMTDNGIEDPTRLRVGQTLKVPGAKSVAATPSKKPVAKKTPAGPYTVQPGNTFYQIARKHSLTVAKLGALNPDVDPGRIIVGQRLLVSGTPSSKSAAVAKSPKATRTKTISTTPAPKPKSSPLPVAKSSPKPTPKPTPKPAPKKDSKPAAKSISSVIVMEEISFGGFADKHGTTPEQLNALNGLSLKGSTVLAKGSELYVASR
jgi:LysM repeat protein